MRTRTQVADPARSAAVGLAWVLAEGELRHVSTFAGMRPAERPAARCPACGGEVTLKLGRVRAHHAAHRPGEECAASRAESVLHLNVKCHLAAALRAVAGDGARLHVEERCLSGRADAQAPVDTDERPSWERWGVQCEESGVRLWLAGWDRVEMERELRGDDDIRRPDIVLMRGSMVVGAIEVRHSHAVGVEKAHRLAALGVPWVEVEADARLADAGTEWTCDRPLPIVRGEPGGGWRCARHVHLLHEWRARRVREAAVGPTPERPAARLRAVRLVDLLYPTGGSTRLLYSIEDVSREGAPPTHVLRRDGQLVREVASQDVDDEAVEALMDGIVDEELRRITASRRATVDSPMHWMRGAVAERVRELFEARDWEALERTHPRRWRWARARGQWFRPRDLSSIRWDPPPGATRLDPHPAAGHAPPPRRPAPPPDPGPHDPLARPRRLEPAVLGPCVVAHEALPAVTLYSLAEAPGGRATSRVIVVPVGRPTPREVERVDRALVDSGRQRLWLSHRARWTRELAHLPWLPVFRRANGEVMVSFRGRTMRLHDVTSAFARGDRKLQPAALARWNAAERLPY
ncbi:MAG TPA: competence protein CoiA family protein [Gemmatimonadales bacterium]